MIQHTKSNENQALGESRYLKRIQTGSTQEHTVTMKLLRKTFANCVRVCGVLIHNIALGDCKEAHYPYTISSSSFV